MLILDAHAADRRADVYSLGRTIAFMVTNVWPTGDVPVEVPPAWKPLVDRMTARSLNERLQTMTEVRAALSSVRQRLREERRDRFKLGPQLGTLTAPETRVLALVLDFGNRVFDEESLSRFARPRVRRREITLGMMALRKRGFLVPATNEAGDVWGEELTPAANEWLIANQGIFLNPALDVLPEQDPSPKQLPADDIPF
jgi:hypothetical protein